MLTLQEVQKELADMADGCTDPQYASAFDYVQQITHQSLLNFISVQEYVYLLKDLQNQLVPVPPTELKNKLNTLVENLVWLVNEEIKKAQEVEVSQT